MRRLVVPLALAGLDVERDQALVEQRIARPVAAVVVAGRHLNGNVDETEFEIGAELRPRACVAVTIGALVEPCVVSILARLGHGVKDPETLAGLHVESAHVPPGIVHCPRRSAEAMRGADDDHVAGNERRRVQADIRGGEIQILVVVELQVDDAAVPECGERLAGFRVEREHPVAGRHVDDALIRSVRGGPVRDTASGAAARGVLASRPFVFGMFPQHRAGRRIERHDRASRPDRRVEHVPDEQRRRRVERVRSRPEVVGGQPPGDLQRREVGFVDLIERGVARAGQIRAVGLPLDSRRPSGLRPAGVLDGRQHVLVRDQRLRSRRNLVRAQEKREDVDVLFRLQVFRRIAGGHLLHVLEQLFQRRAVPPLRERAAGERGGLLPALEIVAVALAAGALVQIGAAGGLLGRVDPGPHGFRRLRKERCV
jgi:hypothetical protein